MTTGNDVDMSMNAVTESAPFDANAMVRILREENLRLKQGLVNIQSNLAESVAVNKENIENCRRIEDNCLRLADESQSIRTDSNELSSAVSEMRKLVETTDTQLLGIGKFVDLIEGVASQTNLLALNATIEAAREQARRAKALRWSQAKSRPCRCRRKRQW